MFLQEYLLNAPPTPPLGSESLTLHITVLSQFIIKLI